MIWDLHMMVYFKMNILDEERNLSLQTYFQKFECFAQLYTKEKTRKVN